MGGKDGKPGDDFSTNTSHLLDNASHRVEGPFDLSTRLLASIRSIKVSLKAAETLAHEDDGFEVEMSDLSSSANSGLNHPFTTMREDAHTHQRDLHISLQAATEPEEEDTYAVNARIEDIPRTEIQRSAWSQDKKPVFKLPEKTRTSSFLFLFLIFSLVFINVLGSTPALSRLPDIFSQFHLLIPTPTTAYIPEGIARIENGSVKVNTLLNQLQNIVPVTLSVGPETVRLTPGAIPSFCPPGPLVDNQHAVGYYPVEITGFDGPQARIHIHPTTISRTNMHSSIQDDIQHWKGWAITLRVEVSPSYSSFLVLNAGNLGSGAYPTFAPVASAPTSNTGPSTSITLSYGASATKAQSNVRQITMYLPGSGCYYINVFWPRGNWQLAFAAGQ